MIYLIGIRHEFQSIGRFRKNLSPEDPPEVFRRYLIDLVSQYSPTLIAEEFSEAIKDELNTREVVGEAVASKLGIDHIFCEPMHGEKGILGVNGVQEKYFGLNSPHIDIYKWPPEAKYELIRDYVRREKKWFKALSNRLPAHKNIFFICGADHFGTFKRRLCRKRSGRNRLKVKLILHSKLPDKGLPYWRA